MGELQFLDINRKLDIIIAQTGKKGPTLLPSAGGTQKAWEITLEEKGWTKEQFAVQIKQREAGWPETTALAGCWSLEGGASPALVKMIDEFKRDNPDLFVKG